MGKKIMSIDGAKENYKEPKTIHDGDLYVLEPGSENSTRAEYLETDGRIGWRLYNRVGQGVLLTEPEIRRLLELTEKAFNKKYGEQ